MKVMVLAEIDGTEVYDVTTDDKLYAVCLAIARRRLESGYYQIPSEPPEPDFHYNNIRQLPESLKEFARLRLSTLKTEKLKYEEAIATHRELERLLAEKDGPAALRYLESRKSHEGEDFEIHEVLSR